MIPKVTTDRCVQVTGLKGCLGYGFEPASPIKRSQGSPGKALNP